MLGDNAYYSGLDTEYQSGLFGMYAAQLRVLPLWLVPGNHDLVSADSATQTGPYYANFSLPTAGQCGGLPSGTEAWYSFDFADIHFVMLDSDESDRTTSGPMLTWLTADLAATTATWTIACFHHPPYTRGSHNSDVITDSGGRMRDMRENAVPLLEAAGRADLVLSGHSHSYERTALIRNHTGYSSTFSAANVVQGGLGDPSGSGPYTKALGTGSLGTVYAVPGSSGQASGGTLDHPAMVRSLNLPGSVLITTAADRMDVKFVDWTGAVQDHFAVDKLPPARVEDSLLY
jgi:hypothetical protein